MHNTNQMFSRIIGHLFVHSFKISNPVYTDKIHKVVF